MRFAFVVVQKHTSSDIRRDWLIKQALAYLQSTTMRLMAKNPSIPPHSGTQAYFWIHMVNAAQASANGVNLTTTISLPVTIDRLSFASSGILFDTQPTVWKSYYSVEIWDSIEARMAFVNPDIKPLPRAIRLSIQGNIGEALSRQLDSTKLGMASELPSTEDLALRAALVMGTARKTSKPVPPKVEGHAHLLLCLYNNLITKADINPNDHLPPLSIASRTTAVMFNLTGAVAPIFMHKAF